MEFASLSEFIAMGKHGPFVWSAYGITIDSVPDEGTRVYIRMPKVREEAEYEKR